MEDEIDSDDGGGWLVVNSLDMGGSKSIFKSFPRQETE